MIMEKTPELDYSEIADKLDDIDTSEIFKSLEEVIQLSQVLLKN